jgi:hypothetical protein
MRTVSALLVVAVAGVVVAPFGCGEGASSAPACVDECSKTGLFGCADPPDNALTVCAEFDDDGCLEWGGPVACDPNESCIAGDCVPGCTDECPNAGDKVCDGNGFRECGEHDTDPCREWSELTSCEDGESCSNGACSETCTHECAEGEKKCEGDGHKSCGEHDSDSCRDWSPVEPCGDGTECDGGECVPVECTAEGEECVCGNNECCEGHCCPFFHICVSWSPNQDVCF